jgi:hypothetical protein
MGSPVAEILAWFNITEPTLLMMKQRDPTFAESYERGADKGKARVRLMIFDNAMGSDGEFRYDKEGEPYRDKRGVPVLFNARPPSNRMLELLALNLLGMSATKEPCHDQSLPAITVIEVVKTCLPPA